MTSEGYRDQERSTLQYINDSWDELAVSADGVEQYLEHVAVLREHAHATRRPPPPWREKDA